MSDELAFFTTISSRDVVAVTGWPSVPVIQQGYCCYVALFAYDIIGQPIARDLACEHAFELGRVKRPLARLALLAQIGGLALRLHVIEFAPLNLEARWDRLRAVSRFSVVRRAKRETRKRPRD